MPPVWLPLPGPALTRLLRTRPFLSLSLLFSPARDHNLFFPDRSLVTNLPKQVMSFFGFPFPEENQSYTTHAQVLDYLCSYADEHNLHPLIHLGCPVESVRPILAADGGFDGDAGRKRSDASPPVEEENRGVSAAGTIAANRDSQGKAMPDRGQENGMLGRWEVVYHRGGGVNLPAADGATTSDTAAAAAAGRATKRVTEEFDAVCICSGHFDEAFTPEAEGMDEFRGRVMHAKEYDTPGVDDFVGKRVLCVGSRSSGTDIAREVSSVGECCAVVQQYMRSRYARYDTKYSAVDSTKFERRSHRLFLSHVVWSHFCASVVDLSTCLQQYHGQVVWEICSSACSLWKPPMGSRVVQVPALVLLL